MVGVTGLGHKSKYLYVASLLELLGSRPPLRRFAQSELFSSCHNKWKSPLAIFTKWPPDFSTGRGDRTKQSLHLSHSALHYSIKSGTQLKLSFKSWPPTKKGPVTTYGDTRTFFGRGDRTRTCDLTHPMRTR